MRSDGRIRLDFFGYGGWTAIGCLCSHLSSVRRPLSDRADSLQGSVLEAQKKTRRCEVSESCEIVSPICWPVQCKCGHLFLERYVLPLENKKGAVGFVWCGFCRTREDVFIAKPASPASEPREGEHPVDDRKAMLERLAVAFWTWYGEQSREHIVTASDIRDFILSWSDPLAPSKPALRWISVKDGMPGIGKPVFLKPNQTTPRQLCLYEGHISWEGCVRKEYIEMLRDTDEWRPLEDGE